MPIWSNLGPVMAGLAQGNPLGGYQVLAQQRQGAMRNALLQQQMMLQMAEFQREQARRAALSRAATAYYNPLLSSMAPQVAEEQRKVLEPIAQVAPELIMVPALTRMGFGKPTAQWRPMTAQERQAYGISPRQSAQINTMTGQVQIPGAAQVVIGTGQQAIDPLKMMHPQTGVRPDPTQYPTYGAATQAGYQFMSGDEQKKVQSRIGAGNLLTELRGRAQEIFTPESDVWSRAKQHVGATLESIAGTDPELSAYLAAREAVLPAFARAMGEVGNLAQEEQARFSVLIPDPRIDSYDTAEEKFRILNSLVTGETTPRQALADLPKFERQPTKPPPAGFIPDKP